MVITFAVAINGQGPSGGAQDNPGARTCLRAKGADAIAASFGKMVDTEMPKFLLSNANIPLAFDQNGLLAVKQVRITKYTSAGLHSMKPMAPNALLWTSKDFSFVAQGSFSTTLFGMGSGSFVAQSTNAAVEAKITVEPNAKNDQKPYLTVSNCTATAKNSELQVDQDGLLGTVLSLYKDAIQKQKVRVVEQLICGTVSYYVQNVINEMLSLGRFNGSVIDASADYPKLTSDLVYNYGLLKPATVSAGSFQLDSYGETSWRNLGGTPFNPANLDSTSVSTDNMMDIYVSDYSFNSMFFHAYSHKMFDALFGDQKSPNFKPALQVSCSAKSQCLGSIFPEMAKNYAAGQNAQMTMTLESAPYLLFSKNQNLFFLNATLNFSAKSKSSNKMGTFLTASSRWECNLNFEFNKNNALTGVISFKKFEFKRIESSLNSTEQKFMNALSDLIKPTLEKEINRKLSKGYALTDNPIGNLVKPVIQYTERTMIISTGFLIDDKYLMKIASQARIYSENR